MLSKYRENLFQGSQDILRASETSESQHLFDNNASPQLVLPQIPFQPKNQNFISEYSQAIDNQSNVFTGFQKKAMAGLAQQQQ